MSYDPNDQMNQKKLGKAAIWLGAILIIVALARIFVLPALLGSANEVTRDAEVQANTPSVETEQILSQDTPVLSAPSATEIDINANSTEDTATNSEQAESTQQDSETSSAISQAPAALQTFFAKVREVDGTIHEITLNAANEEKARQIIRDFRGDPEILNGPALEVTW